MIEIDIRNWYEKKKGDNRKTITQVIKIHKGGRWLAIKATRMDAYGFRKIMQGSKKIGDKWYTGHSFNFSKAISSCNKLYSIKIPRDGWTAIKLKCYNHQDWCDYETIIHIKYLNVI